MAVEVEGADTLGCDALGWRNPTKVQLEALPHALQGKDLIGVAQTGSGKIGAFALSILQSLLDTPQPFFALLLSPTRELAIQIAEQFEALGSGIGVKCALLVGGIDLVQQQLALGKRPHIIVGTPGRLMDHLKNTKGFSLKMLKYLPWPGSVGMSVNDAGVADVPSSNKIRGRHAAKSGIRENEILTEIPCDRRTYLFSATMTEKVRKLPRACLRNPVKIEAASKYSTVNTLKQQYCFVPAKHKECYVVYILTEMSGCTSMVFTRTCDATRLLALILRNLGLRAIPISGQMSQDYVHLVGRTARAGRSGVAISLVNQYELEWYMQIEKPIGKKLPEFPAQEVLLLLEPVTDAKRISNMEMKNSGEKRKRKAGDEDADIETPFGLKNGKPSRKMRK